MFDWLGSLIGNIFRPAVDAIEGLYVFGDFALHIQPWMHALGSIFGAFLGMVIAIVGLRLVAKFL